MKHHVRFTLFLLGLLCIAAPQARSQLDLTINHNAVVGAGAVQGTNGSFFVRGTIAQQAIGNIRSASTDASLGFWNMFPRAMRSAGETENLRTESRTLTATPNPFSEWTQLSLRIPGDERFTLALYDLLGQPVRSIVADERADGRYEIVMPADDLPSGRYTLVMATAHERQTLSLLLVR